MEYNGWCPKVNYKLKLSIIIFKKGCSGSWFCKDCPKKIWDACVVADESRSEKDKFNGDIINKAAYAKAKEVFIKRYGKEEFKQLLFELSI